MNRVPINPELLSWARVRAGLDLEELATKNMLRKLPAWERGETQPTLKQLEEFARVVHVPFGYLFLREPPDERLPIADFRNIVDTEVPRPSPDLIDTLYAMQRRQAWLREYLVRNNAEPLTFAASVRLEDNPEAVGREMRRTLGLERDWAASVHTWKDVVNELRHKIESLGVMAVINGMVGNDITRRLSVTEFRGFALTDNYAPLIFINGADAKSTQMFTLAHELAHIWLGESGLSGFEKLLPGGVDIEDWCNRAAAELLVPSRELQNRWTQARRERNPFEAVARSFKVSPVFAARRAMDLNLIERSTYFEFYETCSSRETLTNSKLSGGDFYDNQNARVGQLLMTCVSRAALEGQIGFRDAYVLTGLWGGTFQDYANHLDIRMVR